MSKNVALWDRGLRILIGLGLLAFVEPHSVWGWLGLIPFATGVTGHCPIYRLLGISTYTARKPPSNTPSPT